MSTLREDLHKLIKANRSLDPLAPDRTLGNPDGTVFIGLPELRDLARRFWTSVAAVSRVVNAIAHEHNVPRIKASDGTPGFELRKEWF